MTKVYRRIYEGSFIWNIWFYEICRYFIINNNNNSNSNNNSSNNNINNMNDNDNGNNNNSNSNWYFIYTVFNFVICILWTRLKE